MGDAFETPDEVQQCLLTVGTSKSKWQDDVGFLRRLSATVVDPSSSSHPHKRKKTSKRCKPLLQHLRQVILAVQKLAKSLRSQVHTRMYMIVRGDGARGDYVCAGTVKNRQTCSLARQGVALAVHVLHMPSMLPVSHVIRARHSLRITSKQHKTTSGRRVSYFISRACVDIFHRSCMCSMCCVLAVALHLTLRCCDAGTDKDSDTLFARRQPSTIYIWFFV